VNCAFFQTKRAFNRFYMFVVLPKWILEVPFSAIYDLRPLTVGLFAKYPALYVLCFNDEYAEAGDKHMIDLRCPIRSS